VHRRTRWEQSQTRSFVPAEPVPARIGAPARVELQRARRLVNAAEAIREFPFEGLAFADDSGRAVLSREGTPIIAAVEAHSTLTVKAEGAEAGNSRIEELNENGEYVSVFGSPGSGSGQFSFFSVNGIAVDSHGDIWVADAKNSRVEERLK
jgi:NHL repeat